MLSAFLIQMRVEKPARVNGNNGQVQQYELEVQLRISLINASISSLEMRA
jgi:hypothetical protein